MYDFGALIKKLRLERGLTQAQLGKKIGRSDAVISQYESNTKTPSPEILMKLSALFRIPLDNLVGNEHKEALLINDLSDEQKQLIKLAVEEFTDNRTNPNVDGLSQRQQQVLSGFMNEFAKKKQ